jgi:hypothetical protein
VIDASPQIIAMPCVDHFQRSIRCRSHSLIAINSIHDRLAVQTWEWGDFKSSEQAVDIIGMSRLKIECALAA